MTATRETYFRPLVQRGTVRPVGAVALAGGPGWFTQFYKKKWDIAVGDRVDIRGSEVKVDGKPMIMATWGRKDDLEMTVRNRQGRPVWDLGVEDF